MQHLDFQNVIFLQLLSFTANQTEIFVGENVNFTDLSTNNPTSWVWIFEGGTPPTSTDQNPIVTYNTAGVYDVTLNVSNAAGADETIAVDYIIVSEEITGDLMITEIMQNPGSPIADENGEWFEVFNPTNNDINLNGWTIKDDGSDSSQIRSSLIVPAKGFVVLGRNSNQSVNGGYLCNYQYSNFQLGNGVDEIVLIAPDDSEIDRVVYDDGNNWPDPNGSSMIFTGMPSDDNNDHTKWTTASLRELSFIGTTGDNGSPGTNGTGQNLVTAVTDIELDIKSIS